MMVDMILKSWQKQKENKYYEQYWLFDLHGTIIKPNYIKGSIEVVYYPFAKECLQIITSRKDIRTIIFTSSFTEELAGYDKVFRNDNIFFKYYNENPEICEENGMFGYYKYKPYFDIMFEDKAGFNPETEWKQIYQLLTSDNTFVPDFKWHSPKLTKTDL
jgi:hypothetical protein